MSYYKIEKISSLGTQLTEFDGIPSLFLESINNWICNDSEIIAVLSPKRETREWIELGCQLINQLHKSAYIGLAVDGSVSNEFQQWLLTIGSNMGEGIIEINMQHNMHPFNENLVNSFTSICTIQNFNNITWPNELWDYTLPKLEFNG